MRAAAYLTFIFLKTTFASEAYVASWLSIQKCETPVLPYAKEIPFDIHVELYNSSKGVPLLRGYVEAKEDIKEERHHAALAYGFETPKGVNWIYDLRNLNCASFAAKTVFNALGIPFTKKCMLKKGKYYINMVDVNKMDHAFQGSMARKYGVYVAAFSFNKGTYSLTCWQTRIKVQPVKKGKNV